MIQIDLITGFLGSGKTTFIRKYASYLIAQGQNIGILENDFGAVNVDAMLLQDILGEHCTLEMVAGGCDADCHRRRFKTKLIAMGMCGYDRVLVEPSGIFDMDEFFDALHESPLDRWYEIGNVITIIDADLEPNLSENSRYLLASQVAQAGAILYSHTQEISPDRLAATRQYVRESLELLHGGIPESENSHQTDGANPHEQLAACDSIPDDAHIWTKDWNLFDAQDYQAILTCGYHTADYAKRWFDEKQVYDSLYFMNMDFTKDFLLQSSRDILNDPACGRVFRIKGFQKLPDGTWLSVNVTHQKTEIHPIPNGQAILIVIGEGLRTDAIEGYWGKSKP